MDAPKCKLCRERHWGLCPHAMSALEKVSAAKPGDIVDVTPTELKAYTSPKFDRVAYQWEYMRKRRAKQKESGHEEVRTL